MGMFFYFLLTLLRWFERASWMIFDFVLNFEHTCGMLDVSFRLASLVGVFWNS